MQLEDGAQPLILINGNRYNSGIATLDPREIESVEIIDVVKARYLKDGYQKILNIKLKKKTQPFIFLEGATRHDETLDTHFMEELQWTICMMIARNRSNGS